MKPFHVRLIGLAAAAWLCAAEPASAAWNNVFQATCFLRPKSQTSYYQAPVVVQSAPVVGVQAYSSPCCDPCPKPQCTTSYVQRCYYQPVTSYQTKTYYEPVTTYQTSYYYEPVTSYKYSCYYDPCTCSYQQVAVPSVSYSLKAKSCPVQSWVQRCTSVPVTTYQQAFYWEPQTTCCSTTVGAPIFPSAPNGVGGVTGPPPVAQPQMGQPPMGPPPVNEQKTPGVSTPPPPPAYEKYYGPPMNEGSQTKAFSNPNGIWQGYQTPLGNPVPTVKPLSQPPVPTPKQTIPLDKFVSLSGSDNPSVSGGNLVKGQVVFPSNTPRPNTQLVFVNANQKTAQQAVTANNQGQFDISLASGQWLVYIHRNGNEPVYHSKIEISNQQPSYITLVSK